ncbi:sodium channel modifier 1 isoform X1 [Pogoniulus pusillus]|uniref:sodium channel modifier 1 isoform X1 n=1 Tax=Pogoniulus pusillus TaxID=488313 RepID=UPI0030B93659
MSFKREGDDPGQLGVLQRRRIADLLANYIPEEEALLLRSGKYACTVCAHRPVFDTLEVLTVHRAGRRHRSSLQHFYGRKGSPQAVAQQQGQGQEVQAEEEGSPAPLLARTRRITHSALLKAAPYSSCCRRAGALGSSSRVGAAQAGPNSALPLPGAPQGHGGAAAATPAAALPGHRGGHGGTAAATPAAVLPGHRGGHGAAAAATPAALLPGHRGGHGAAAAATPAAVLPGHRGGHGAAAAATPAAVLPGHRGGRAGTPRAAAARRQPGGSGGASAAAPSPARRQALERYLQLRSAGWLQDPSGKWVKDQNVEFDSDEEEPPALLPPA